MKLLLNKYTFFVILTALVSLIILFGYNTISNQKNEINRLKSNQEQLITESKNTQLVMTKKELLEFRKSLVDEIKDSLDIKPSQITNVSNVYTSFIDSSNNYYPVIMHDSIIDVNVQELCYHITGEVNTKSKQFQLKKIEFTDTIRIVDYFVRNKLFGVWFLPRTGKKSYYRQSYSKCSSDVKTEEITIKKYKSKN